MDGAAEHIHVKEAIDDCVADMLAKQCTARAAAAATTTGTTNDMLHGAVDHDSCFACDDFAIDDDNVDGPRFVYDDDGDVMNIAPRMPCTGTVPAEHREKHVPSLYNACVARPVKPVELKVNDKARKDAG